MNAERLSTNGQTQEARASKSASRKMISRLHAPVTMGAHAQDRTTSKKPAIGAGALRAGPRALLVLSLLAALAQSATAQFSQFGAQLDNSLLAGGSSAPLELDLLGQALDEQLQQQQQHRPQHHDGSPGHYEFEVAPKLEPPSARRPPFRQTNQQCPGADLFASFSTRHTLCGDLNQGKVPANPLGQSITDQAYPFELIKNKTLQFLARALPVLKHEYEVIPKVARYLPAQQLLNPTNLASPLGLDHFHELNRHLGVSDQDGHVQRMMSQRRRKRSPAPVNRQASITVADMAPNATLVVSSAHSGGRIRAHDHSLAMITKDGYRPISAGQRPPIGVRSAPQQQQQAQANGAEQHERTGQNKALAADDHQAQIGHDFEQQNLLQERNNGNGAEERNRATQSKQLAEVRADDNGAERRSSTVDQQQPQLQQQVPSTAPSTQTTATSSRQNSQMAATSQVHKKRSSCSDVGGPILSTVCQTAAALIEGETAPAWLRLLKDLGSLYAGSSDSLGASIWSSPAGQAADTIPTDGSSSGSGSIGGGEINGNQRAKAAPVQVAASPLQTMSNVFGLLGPLASYLAPSLQRDSSSTATSVKRKDRHDSQQQRSNVMAKYSNYLLATTALAGLIDYFAPSLLGPANGARGSLFGLAESRARSSVASNGFARRKNQLDNLVDTPASLAAMKQQPALATGKQPPTPCPSVEEYISPTFARNYQGAWKYVVQIPHEGYFTQTIQRSSCLRQKCEFTDGVCHEAPRWVSLLVAEIYYPNAIFGSATGGGGQPLLEPALAGAQSSQQAQHVPQPVALGAPPPQQQQQQQHGAPHDPLQMADSLNNHNNLNNFLSAQALGDQFAYGTLDQFHRHGLHGPEARMSQAAAGQQPQMILQNGATNTDQHLSNDYIKALAIETLRQNPHLSLDELIKSLQLQTAARRKKRDLLPPAQQRPQFYAQTAPSQQHTIQQQQQQQQQLQASQLEHQHRQKQQVAEQQMQQQMTSQAPVSLSTLAVDNAASSTVGDSHRQLSQHQTSSAQSQLQQQQQQPECDGYDKIGCYVVRVYYDWFLVNGSCKCWKTNLQSQTLGAQSSAGNASGSFIRRIFTG